MTDITTIEEVSAGEYTVRVAQTEDGTAWEAVVIDASDNTSHRSSFPMITFGAMSGSSQSSDDSGPSKPLGPPVTAPHRWVAIGFAIEAYEWGEVDEDVTDVQDAYQMVDVDGITLTDERTETYRSVFEDMDLDGGEDDD